MDFSFDFIVNVMASFYDFFFGISSLLTKTPEGIWITMLNGGTTPVVPFEWSWFNPFLQTTSSASFTSNAIFELFRNYVSNNALFDYGWMPIWQIILVGLTSFWFIALVVKVIIDIVT